MTSRPDVIFSGLVGNAPDAVRRLVGHFDQSRKVFLSPDYKEEQLRAEFLNPFFESLGWDVANKAGLTEVFKPDIHEEPIKTAGATDLTGGQFRCDARRRPEPPEVRVTSLVAPTGLRSSK